LIEKGDAIFTKPDFYPLHSMAAKNIILDDRHTRQKRKRLQVDVGNELSPFQRIVNVDEQTMNTELGAAMQIDGVTPVIIQDGAEVVLLLDEHFFQTIDIKQLRYQLAQFFAVSTDRFILTTAATAQDGQAHIRPDAPRIVATLGGGGGGGGGG
jgi:hypothetical protein